MTTAGARRRAATPWPTGRFSNTSREGGMLGHAISDAQALAPAAAPGSRRRLRCAARTRAGTFQPTDPRHPRADGGHHARLDRAAHRAAPAGAVEPAGD